MRSHRTLTALLLAACGAATMPPPPAPFPEQETNATLAGHRCESTSRCRCRVPGLAEDQAEQTLPTEGTRRFELRIASSLGLAWVVIDGKEQFFKDVQRAEDCYYFDLAPGPHSVEVRAKEADPAGGFGTAVKISEYNPAGPWWYDSFVFECGPPGACDKETMAAWKADVLGDRHQLRDVCGATNVRDVKWETGKMPDALHPEDLSLSFTLSVFKGGPSYQPRDPACPEK